MGRISWILLGWLALLPPAHSVSFDCAKATTSVEKSICGDDKLSQMDSDLAVAYKQALERSDDKQKLVHEQRQWIQDVRNACADAICLTQAYTARLKQLSTISCPSTSPSSCSRSGTADIPATSTSSVVATPAASTALVGLDRRVGELTQSDKAGEIATPVASFQETYDGIVGAMAFSVDDDRLAIVPGGTGGDLHVWEWRDHPHLTMKLDWPSRFHGAGAMNTIAYSGDGKLLAFAHNSEKSDGAIKTVRIYDAQSGMLVHEVFENAALNPTFALTFTLDSKSLLQLHAGQNKLDELVAYRVGDWARTVGSLKYPFTATARAMALSPNGNLLAIAGQRWQPDPHPQIVILDMASLTVRTVIDGPFKDWDDDISICWSPDGRDVIAGTSWLSTSDPEMIKVFDVSSGAQLPAPLPDGIFATQLAVTPNGKYLIVSSLREVDIVDLEHKKIVQKLLPTDPVGFNIAVSHDGRYLATASLGNRIAIWKLQ